MEGQVGLMSKVSFSEVTNLLESIRLGKSATLKLEMWNKYFKKFQESHKNEVCKSKFPSRFS